jgi:hypothetical protein
MATTGRGTAFIAAAAWAPLPEAQRRLEVGNVVFRLHHPRLADPAHRTGILSLIYLAKPIISYEYARRLHGAGRLDAATFLKHILNVAREPLGTAGFLANWAWVRTLAARKFPSLVVVPCSNVYSIDVHGEQAPNPQSRVTLSDNRDPLGMPRIHIDWRHSPCDIRMVAEGLRQLQFEFSAFGGASLHYTPGEVERTCTFTGCVRRLSAKSDIPFAPQELARRGE